MMKYERLTEKAENGKPYFDGCLRCDLESDCGLCSYWASGLDRLAELEDKIEQGTLIELPCKVGDTVYNTDSIRVYQGEIMEISLTPKHFIFTADTVCFDERAIGTRVFLTREEAEKRLEELKGGKE
jgi:hypothetical protein